MASDDTALSPPLWHRVRGGSMRPALRDGDLVLLSLARAPARRGEVVVTRGPHGNLIIHRVVESGPDAVITRGDACPANDLPVPPGRVLLHALAVRRRGRIVPIPARAPAALRWLRSAARSCRAWLAGARGRSWTVRPSSSICTEGGSWD